MRKLKTNKIKHLVVHHSESGGGGVAFLRHCHTSPDPNDPSKPWDDIGYHYVIGNGIAWGGYAALADGATADGRDVKYQGAHCKHYNAESIGICVIGRLDKMEPTKNQIRSLTGLLSELCLRYHLPASTIVGHRDLNATTCPGDNLYELLPRIRREVRATLAAVRMSAGIRGGKI